ncbi:MAG TPA: hypothetical protein VMR90_08920 [Candidatus Cybelea sp.]|nr:hypothetical protein [Candidatus Cybelea sp.]
MSKIKFSASLLAFSLLLAGGAIAGNTNRGTLKFDEPVTVGGKQLPVGKYELEWAGTGPEVELSISNDKGTVVKVPAEIHPLEKAGAANGYTIDTDQAGNKALTGILFGGKKYELSILGASAATPRSSDKAPGSN